MPVPDDIRTLLRSFQGSHLRQSSERRVRLEHEHIRENVINDIRSNAEQDYNTAESEVHRRIRDILARLGQLAAEHDKDLKQVEIREMQLLARLQMLDEATMVTVRTESCWLPRCLSDAGREGVSRANWNQAMNNGSLVSSVKEDLHESIDVWPDSFWNIWKPEEAATIQEDAHDCQSIQTELTEALGLLKIPEDWYVELNSESRSLLHRVDEKEHVVSMESYLIALNDHYERVWRVEEAKLAAERDQLKQKILASLQLSPS